MSRFAKSVRRALAAALAILLGGLVLVSLMVETGAKPPALLSVLGVGGRRMMIVVNGGLGHRTLEALKEDNDPFSSMKRRVPNGPDPIHNRGAGESGRSPGRA